MLLQALAFLWRKRAQSRGYWPKRMQLVRGTEAQSGPQGSALVLSTHDTVLPSGVSVQRSFCGRWQVENRLPWRRDVTLAGKSQQEGGG